MKTALSMITLATLPPTLGFIVDLRNKNSSSVSGDIVKAVLPTLIIQRRNSKERGA